MPRACSVCTHPDKQEIDRLLLEHPIRDVSGQTGIGKSALGRHKMAHLPGALVLANEREIERHKQVFAEARAVQRSLSGWRDQGEWLEVCTQAENDYQSGKFLLDCLGAERHLDPQETATLLHLRQRLIQEMALTTALEMMLIDLAILAYANVLRVQGWIGNLALLIEHDAFRDEGPTMKVNARNGRYSGLNVEAEAARVREQLLPAFDRASKTFLSAIRTLREFRASGVNVNIAAAQQVNVAEQQLVVGPSVPDNGTKGFSVRDPGNQAEVMDV